MNQHEEAQLVYLKSICPTTPTIEEFHNFIKQQTTLGLSIPKEIANVQDTNYSSGRLDAGRYDVFTGKRSQRSTIRK